jgi:hypothetical protein
MLVSMTNDRLFAVTVIVLGVLTVAITATAVFLK